MSLSVQQERIAKRARESEGDLPESFLRALNAKYDEYFGPKGIYKPTGILNTDVLSLDEVASEIRDRIMNSGEP